LQVNFQRPKCCCDKIAREHYLKSRRISATANQEEIAQKIKELFIADLGIEEHQFTRQASFG
jgi:hypothetical protein